MSVVLTDIGSTQLAPALGPASTGLEGAFVADSSGHYVVAVRQVQRRDRDPVSWRGEHVAVPHALVASVRERRLSRTRTTIAGLVAIAGAVLAGRAVGDGFDVGGGRPGPGEGAK